MATATICTGCETEGMHAMGIADCSFTEQGQPTPGHSATREAVQQAMAAFRPLPTLPECFVAITTPMAHPGHWSVLGATEVTGHWVSRSFDAFAVIDRGGYAVATADTLAEAAVEAVRFSLQALPMADRQS